MTTRPYFFGRGAFLTSSGSESEPEDFFRSFTFFFRFRRCALAETFPEAPPPGSPSGGLLLAVSTLLPREFFPFRFFSDRDPDLDRSLPKILALIDPEDDSSSE